MSQNNTCSPEKSCGSCDTTDTCDSHTQQRHMDERLEDRLSSIKHRLVVMSGKGGVGKSTVAANLAVALAAEGHRVGILDGDVHGPNIPKMLGLEGASPQGGPAGMLPLEASVNLKVMSMAFLLPDSDTPVAWRGPMKHTLFQQFLADVDWGELDYLIVDLPPGTGDEPMSIAQILGKPLWTIIVTTPQDVALLDSRKSVMFAKNLDMNVLGIIENMSGLICPHCAGEIDLFKTGGGKRASKDLEVPFLGAIPIDPNVVLAGDAGIPIANLDSGSEISEIFRELAARTDRVVKNGSVPLQFAAADNLSQIETERRSTSHAFQNCSCSINASRRIGRHAFRTLRALRCFYSDTRRKRRNQRYFRGAQSASPAGRMSGPGKSPATEPCGRSDSGRHRHEAPHGLSSGGNRCLLRPGR